MPENQVALPVYPPLVGVEVGVTPGVVEGVGVVPAVGVMPGVGVGVVPGVGVGLLAPLQVLPFTVKPVGVGLLPDQVPLKPGMMEPFAGTLPFQLAFVTVTF